MHVSSWDQAGGGDKVSYTRMTEIVRSQIYVLLRVGNEGNEIGRDKDTVSREVRLDAQEKFSEWLEA